MPNRRKKFQEFRACECGCGTMIPRYIEEKYLSPRDGREMVKLGSERRYAFGHSSRTIAHRNRVSQTFTGERNPNWKGGVTKERDKLKASAAYKTWVVSVYRRDRYFCQLCGRKCDRKNRPEAHHIRPVRDFPELVLDVNNGVTLCALCHELTYGKEHEFEDLLTARIANAVNSGEASPARAEGNPEPSREGNLSEGVTTRG